VSYAVFGSFTSLAGEICRPAEEQNAATNVFDRFKRSAHLQKLSTHVHKHFSAVLKDLHTCRKDFSPL
jgi:hypothetical protein